MNKIGCVMHDCDECLGRPRKDAIALLAALVIGAAVPVLLFIPGHRDHQIALQKARIEGIQEGAAKVALRCPAKLSDFNTKEPKK